MMVIAMIQARMSSSRLQGKVLKTISGRPMLSCMVERIKHASSITNVLIITSVEVSDDPIERFCRDNSLGCFRGSLDDVLDRYHAGAAANGCKDEDIIVRLTGDCPLIDPRVIDDVVRCFKANNLDYCANTAPPEGSTYPDGMDVEVFSFAALHKAWNEAQKPSDREHVTFYFWKNPDIFKTKRYDLNENLSHVRLTVDYPEDYEVVKEIFNSLYPANSTFSMKDILEYLSANQMILQRNASIERNQGWNSAFEKDKKAGF